LEKPGRFYFWDSRICVCYKKSDCRASANEPTQKGDEELYKILRYVILFTVKTLKLTVTSTLGTLWEGGRSAGVFGELCVPAENSWLRPC